MRTLSLKTSTFGGEQEREKAIWDLLCPFLFIFNIHMLRGKKTLLYQFRSCYLTTCPALIGLSSKSYQKIISRLENILFLIFKKFYNNIELIRILVFVDLSNFFIL